MKRPAKKEMFRWKDGAIQTVSRDAGDVTEITIIDLLNPERYVRVGIGDMPNHKQAARRFAVRLRQILNREMPA